jgi:hypothetical protein
VARKPPALSPGRLALIVPFREHAIDRAWTRWISSAGNNLDTRFDDLARAAQGFPSATQRSRVEAILKGAGLEAFSATALLSRPVESVDTIGHTARITASDVARSFTVRHIRHPIATAGELFHPRWSEVKQAIISGNLDHPAVFELVHDVLKHRSVLSKALDQALAETISQCEDLPTNPTRTLLNVLPPRPASWGIAALRIIAPGDSGALAELRSIRPTVANNVVRAFSPPLLAKLGSALLAVTSLDGEGVFPTAHAAAAIFSRSILRRTRPVHRRDAV